MLQELYVTNLRNEHGRVAHGRDGQEAARGQRNPCRAQRCVPARRKSRPDFPAQGQSPTELQDIIETKFSAGGQLPIREFVSIT